MFDCRCLWADALDEDPKMGSSVVIGGSDVLSSSELVTRERQLTWAVVMHMRHDRGATEVCCLHTMHVG